MKHHVLVMFAVVGAAGFSGCGVAQAQGAKEAQGIQVLVVTRDLAAGDTVTFGDLGPGLLPADWPLGSSMKPEAAGYVVNQRVNVPVLKGEVLHWGFFEVEREDPQTVEQCRRAAQPAATAREQIARSRQVILSRAPSNRR